MPGKPRAGRVAPRWELTSQQLLQLCTRSCYVPEETLSAADLPHAWASVRDELLRRYAEACPGNRPWAWWLLEAPMPRQCLQGGHICLQRDRILQQEKNGNLYYGRPGVYACPACWQEVYESQARYLRRHQLLLPPEEGVVPLTLAACDVWAARQSTDDHRHPWKPGEALRWCTQVLSRV